MAATCTCFQSERAPCGRTVGGERYQDRDEEGLVIDHVYYACGCRSIRDEYYDGSVHHRVVRHDGKVLAEEKAEHHL
jgi:hypothetical protein